MTAMRFLLVPNFANPYDRRMVNGLAEGFREIGCDAVALGAPMPAESLATIVDRVRPDVVMQVNRFRPTDPTLPSSVRHIAWFQDVFPDTNIKDERSECAGDIVYALGDAKALGLKAELPCFIGSLVTGVDQSTTEVKRKEWAPLMDFSLCGYIPAPFIFRPNVKSDLVWYLNDLFDRLPIVGGSWTFRRVRARLLRRYINIDYVPYALATSLQQLATALYRPLRGELDIDLIAGALRAAAQPYVKMRRGESRSRHWSRRGRLGRVLAPYRTSGADRRTAVDSLINALAREYPRLLDRVALVGAALLVSRSLELYGPGWDSHETFRAYHKGVIEDQPSLLAIFQRSRINLANNTHGLGLHSRTLECMAVGGFIFMHRSPHDERPGGMLTSFEPGVHYGAYTPETFHDEALRWLSDEPRRTKVGAQGAAVIREKHLWRHRAEQIVGDLKR
ncbi:MAG TPA: glycosyltransferase [Xanthobacteraceae bacterium]|nr:glycosyltransferase [Xanthobacteraceae bacterium]